MLSLYFMITDTATTEIYTLSLHDALPIYRKTGGKLAPARGRADSQPTVTGQCRQEFALGSGARERSEEHTSELQSLTNLVCRLLLEKKKQRKQRSRPAPGRQG